MAWSLRQITFFFAIAIAIATFGQQAVASERSEASRPVLLVVDAQVGVLSGVWQAERVTDNVAELVVRARRAGVPIVWVQHADAELPRDSDRWQLVARLGPLASDIVVHKNFNSSFANTDLDAQLRELGASRIVLAGAATNWCVRATAYAAVDRGYDVTLVGDAHSTESIEFADGRTVPAETIVAEFNATFPWLAVPDARTEVVKAAAVTF